MFTLLHHLSVETQMEPPTLKLGDLCKQDVVECEFGFGQAEIFCTLFSVYFDIVPKIHEKLNQVTPLLGILLDQLFQPLRERAIEIAARSDRRGGSS
jgi:hypothetical protein